MKEEKYLKMICAVPKEDCLSAKGMILYRSNDFYYEESDIIRQIPYIYFILFNANLSFANISLYRSKKIYRFGINCKLLKIPSFHLDQKIDNTSSLNILDIN